MREKIRSAFFEYGWLLPLLTPAAQVGGRALINVLLLIYLLWALAAVPGTRVRLERPLLVVYAVLLIAYLCSIPGALDMKMATHEWVKFALHSLTFYVTSVVLWSRPQALARLIPALGYAGLILFAALLAVLPWKMMQPGFEPIAVLIEDNLPFLAPFMLILLWRGIGPRYRLAAMTALAALILVYVLYSEGRAALLGLIVALFLSMLLVVRTGRVKALIVSALVLGCAIVLSASTFFREHLNVPQTPAVPTQTSNTAPGWIGTLDRFTSYRTVLWRQALQNPPSNLLTGVGMANVGLYDKVVTVEVGDTSAHLGHLHNFLFDAWYATGFLGLAALLVFIGYPVWRGWQAARAADDASALTAGLLLASVGALLAGGMLSFSYTSNQFSLYLPMLLAALWYLSGSPQLRRDQA